MNAQEFTSALQEDPDFQSIQIRYQSAGIDITPYLTQAINRYIPEGEYSGAIKGILSAVVSFLASELKRATRKEPTTFFGRLLRAIFG